AILVVFSLVITSLLSVSVHAIALDHDDGLMDSAWPMFQHDVYHTGRSPYGASGSTGILKWKFRLCNWNTDIESSPVIDKNGNIYIGADEYLYKVYPNGTLNWKIKLGIIKSSPAIAKDGTIHIGSYVYVGGGLYNTYLNALYQDGTIKWQFEVEETADAVFSSPAIDKDGTIYFGVVGPGWNLGRVYAVYPNGTEKWYYDTGFWVYDSPAINNGTVYIDSNDGYLYALYTNNGTLKWRYRAVGDVYSAPTIGDDGTIYVGSTNGYLYAINPNGTLKWRYPTGRLGGSSPSLAKNETIYVGSNPGYIYAINPDGTLKWKYKTGDDVLSSPAIDKNGIIYVGSTDRTFYALNPNGTLRWKYSTSSYITSSPAIGEDGTIYFASWDGYLYAIKVIENYPPNKPNLTGPTTGNMGENLIFTVVTNDPDNDRVYYQFDWDDGSNSGWLGPYNSGETIKVSHTWLDGGNYNVKVQAKDFYNSSNSYSEWSQPLQIKISGPNIEIISLQGGFGVTATIKNIGNENATKVHWKIYMHGEHVFFIKPFNHNWAAREGTTCLKVNETKTVKILTFGIGSGELTVTVNIETSTAYYQIFGPIVILYTK
ncbi:MAG: PQQ-binding-like beta-propeller repeat protein, partial [Thermoplasmata archaeon]|nr:PQQ-binding-like beta-propeller repeat protein [Thermoplasmata archaeon]